MPEGNSDISSMLSKVLSDPDAMKRIGALAENLRSNGTAEAASGSEANDGAQQEEHSEKKAPLQLPQGLNKKENDQRMALLSALKPYLGSERREKVDMIIKMLRILSLADLGALLK